jgi:hypothetical protein
MKLHGNARTCPHSRLLIAKRVEVQGWTLGLEVASLLSRGERAGPARSLVSAAFDPASHQGGAGARDRGAAPLADDRGGDRGGARD